MSRNYINYHILISHSPSCLNRDDMNMQKSAIFGGVRRVRISSQSLKRAMRKSDYYATYIGKPSDRTRELSLLYRKTVKALQDSYPKELITKAITFLSDKREFNLSDVQADAVAPWCKAEIAWLCDALSKDADLESLCDQYIKIKGNSDADKKKKTTLVNKAVIVIKRNVHIPSIETAIANTKDIALSGRMATSGLMTSIDGAMAVAQAITTHAVDADIDWFTAVDDLVSDEGEVGAGHLDTQEFSSGVFYRYASLNLKQLQVNLGLISDMQSDETPESRKKALEIARHVLHLLATIVPSAKQQSFAAHNLADYALVSFSDIPVSLANAFEKPVKSKEGFLIPSINRLKDYWKTIHDGYGLDEKCAQFQLVQTERLDGTVSYSTLKKLEKWIEEDGKEVNQ